MNLIYISFFGLIGIFLRYGIDSFLNPRFPNFPVGTLIINILGSFAAGWIYMLASREVISSQMQIALLVGLCGGFTTFSAYSLQSLILAEKGATTAMLIYFIGSPILGLVSVYAGLYGARLIFK